LPLVAVIAAEVSAWAGSADGALVQANNVMHSARAPDNIAVLNRCFTRSRAATTDASDRDGRLDVVTPRRSSTGLARRATPHLAAEPRHCQHEPVTLAQRDNPRTVSSDRLAGLN
jgi:hypothetical protein